jgi:hypothetical protein
VTWVRGSRDGFSACRSQRTNTVAEALKPSPPSANRCVYALRLWWGRVGSRQASHRLPLPVPVEVAFLTSENESLSRGFSSARFGAGALVAVPTASSSPARAMPGWAPVPASPNFQPTMPNLPIQEHLKRLHAVEAAIYHSYGHGKHLIAGISLSEALIAIFESSRAFRAEI